MIRGSCAEGLQDERQTNVGHLLYLCIVLELMGIGFGLKARYLFGSISLFSYAFPVGSFSSSLGRKPLTYSPEDIYGGIGRNEPHETMINIGSLINYRNR